MCSPKNPSSAERLRILRRSSLYASNVPVSWISWRWVSSRGRTSRSMKSRSVSRRSSSSDGIASGTAGTSFVVTWNLPARRLPEGRLPHARRQSRQPGSSSIPDLHLILVHARVERGLRSHGGPPENPAVGQPEQAPVDRTGHRGLAAHPPDQALVERTAGVVAVVRQGVHALGGPVQEQVDDALQLDANRFPFGQLSGRQDREPALVVHASS